MDLKHRVAVVVGVRPHSNDCSRILHVDLDDAVTGHRITVVRDRRRAVVLGTRVSE